MATLIKWRKGIDVDIGDLEHEFLFNGVRAIGDIDGRRFIQLICLDKEKLDDPHFDLEGYVRSIVKNTKAEDITITANYVCD
jgi:hypothetical protein